MIFNNLNMLKTFDTLENVLIQTNKNTQMMKTHQVMLNQYPLDRKCKGKKEDLLEIEFLFKKNVVTLPIFP